MKEVERLEKENKKLKKEKDSCNVGLAESKAALNLAIKENAQLSDDHRKVHEENVWLRANEIYWKTACEKKEEECKRLKAGIEPVQTLENRTGEKSKVRVLLKHVRSEANALMSAPGGEPDVTPTL